jgi:hypothetical protein
VQAYFGGLVVALFLVGCGTQDREKVVGTEGGSCFPNGSCSGGLSCLSKLCVNADSGAHFAGGGRSNSSGGADGNVSGDERAARGGDTDASSESGPALCGATTQDSNGTPDAATQYTIGSTTDGCISSSTDRDYYEFAAPTDVTGGYFEITLTAASGGMIEADLYGLANSRIINSFHATSSAESVEFWFAASSGQGFRLDVLDFGPFTSPYAYTLAAIYNKVDDQTEPNDYSDARGIGVGYPVNAYLFEGSTASLILKPVDHDIFHTTVGGSVTGTLENVPTDIRAVLSAYENAASSPVSQTSTTMGAPVTVTYTLPSVGGLYFEISAAEPAPTSGAGPLPDHFTRPYKLTISQ